ncbi:unnamed protein product [Natator depressus]
MPCDSCQRLGDAMLAVLGLLVMGCVGLNTTSLALAAPETPCPASAPPPHPKIWTRGADRLPPRPGPAAPSSARSLGGLQPPKGWPKTLPGGPSQLPTPPSRRPPRPGDGGALGTSWSPPSHTAQPGQPCSPPPRPPHPHLCVPPAPEPRLDPPARQPGRGHL